MVDAKTVIRNDVLEENRLLVFSDGYVRTYTELGTTREGGMFRRSIRATVHRRDVSTAPPETNQEGNARQLYAEALTKVRRYRVGTILLQNALDGFSADYSRLRWPTWASRRSFPEILNTCG